MGFRVMGPTGAQHQGLTGETCDANQSDLLYISPQHKFEVQFGSEEFYI